MWMKLIGLLVAGVFVGATIYEVTQRRSRKHPRAPEPAAEEAKEEQPTP